MYVASNSFVLPLRMNGMHSMQFDPAPLDLLSAHNLITVVLTVCHLHKAQRWSKSVKKCLIVGYRSLSLALCDLWLLLVCISLTLFAYCFISISNTIYIELVMLNKLVVVVVVVVVDIFKLTRRVWIISEFVRLKVCRSMSIA